MHDARRGIDTDRVDSRMHSTVVGVQTTQATRQWNRKMSTEKTTFQTLYAPLDMRSSLSDVNSA